MRPMSVQYHEPGIKAHAEDAARYAAKAKAIFANLRALDPNQAAREELRAAGISESSIAALYPESFEALVPNLVQHLGYNFASVMLVPRIQAMTGSLPQVIRQLRADAAQRYHAEEPADLVAPRQRAAFPELHRSLVDRWKVSEDNAHMLSAALWRTWWLMLQPQEVKRSEFVDLLMIEVADYMLHDLLPPKN